MIQYKHSLINTTDKGVFFKAPVPGVNFLYLE